MDAKTDIEVIEIAVPPSANHLWSIFGNRMHKKKAYRDWLDHCACLVKESGAVCPEGPVSVTVEVSGGKGFSRARDIDNCIKPCLDLLRFSEFLETDNVSKVRRVSAVYKEPCSHKAVSECRLIVEGV